MKTLTRNPLFSTLQCSNGIHAAKKSKIIVVKDLEPILNVLCNYQAGFVLSTDEVAILSEWLKESERHQKLYKDLGNWMKIYMGNVNGNPRESIQNRLIELEGMGD